MIIVDTCVLPAVFDKASPQHSDFRAVLGHIQKYKRAMDVGGSRMKKELAKAEKYLRVINQLSASGKVAWWDDKLVDAEQQRIEAAETDADFDDPHLLALQIVSRAEVICTQDQRAFPFIKKKSLYPKGHKRALIYSRRSKRFDRLLA